MAPTIDMSLMYCQMQALYNGCDSTTDAIHVSECLFTAYPEHKQLIISYRDSLIYPDNVDTQTKISSLVSVINTDTKDEALELKNSLCGRSTDIIYVKTLERIVSRKRNRSNYVKPSVYDTVYITKRCPHCSMGMKMDENSIYVICGYPNTHRGYDWKGCGTDWCFQCEKMLCKTWEKDELNIESNRYHDANCCKAHSKRSGCDYTREYCHCPSNPNVLR